MTLQWLGATTTPQSGSRWRATRIGVRVLAIGCLLLAGGASQAFGQTTGSVIGAVRSEGSGSLLPGAVVELENGGEITRSVTDAQGRYQLLDAPAGRGILRARHLGHAALEMEIVVPQSRQVVVDLALALQPVPMPPVTVQGNAPRGATDSLSVANPELGLAGTRALEASPGMAELGIADAVRGIPGKEPTDPGSVLYVRGAAADLKLVYLDGAPVYAPFPLGGLLDPFSPGVLNRADIYLGGAPARYDGGLSYVMDLRTRASNGSGVRASGSADLLSARLLAQAGIGERVGVIATARGIHPLASAGVFGGSLPYGYHEGLVRADAALGDQTLLSFTGFTNQESVRLGDASVADSLIEWGNNAGSARLGTVVGKTIVELTAALGDYSARLPLSGTRPLVADGTATRKRFSADFARGGDIQVRYGLSLDDQEYRATATSPVSSAPSSIVASSGRVIGLYAEGTGRVGTRVRLRGGGRVDHFSSTGDSSTGDVTFAPRVAATWLITERAAMTFAAGSYHQFLRPPDEVLLSEPLRAAVGTVPLSVARASHLTVSLDQDLGEETRLGIEGFFKDFSNIPGTEAMEANASGVDFWVRRSGEALTGWLGYSLAWVWSDSGEENQAEFAGRHLLSAGLGAPLGDRTRIDLRFAYGAGLPYSGIPLSTEQFATVGSVENSFERDTPSLMAAQRGGTETAPLLYTPDKAFLRLDAAIAQRWNPRWQGRTIQVEPYIKLLNGLGRRDALFYFVGGGDEDPRAIGNLPVIPVAGISFDF